MMKLWRYLKGFLWLLDEWLKEKTPINHQISRKSSPSLCSHLACHIILKYNSPLSHSALCLPLKIHEAPPFTAAIHWINLTSPRVWPSDKIQTICSLSCIFLFTHVAELCFLWAFISFICPHFILKFSLNNKTMYFVQWLYHLVCGISMKTSSFFIFFLYPVS